MRDYSTHESFAELLIEFERLSQDERLFFDFVNLDDVTVHATFRRADGASRAWSVWYPLDEKGSRQTCSKEYLPAVLAAFGVPSEAFSLELSNCLLLQAAYADEFIRQVSELLGADAVRKCIRRTQDFMTEMRQAVENLNQGGDGALDSTGRQTPPPVPVVPRTGDGNTTPSRSEATGDQPAEEGTASPSDRDARKSRLRIIRS